MSKNVTLSPKKSYLPNSEVKPLYQVWKGKNNFFCHGKIISG